MFDSIHRAIYSFICRLLFIFGWTLTNRDAAAESVKALCPQWNQAVKHSHTSRNPQRQDEAGLAEVSVREDERGDQGPEVEAEAQPAGAHLHPHSGHDALHGLGGGVGSVEGDTEKRGSL